MIPLAVVGVAVVAAIVLLRTLDRTFVGGVSVGVLFVAVFACALAVGWIFSTIDEGSGIARWDEPAAEWGADNATATSTDILGATTDFGGTAYLVVLMALVGAYHAVRHHDWGPMLYLAAVGIGVTLLNNGLKLIIDRDRPDIGQLTGHAGSSFPSGHSAAAAACWAAIALVFARGRSRPIRFVLLLIAVVISVAVAATRVLLGVHWVSDVVAGVLVGWTWFFAVTVVFGGRLLQLGEPADRIASDGVESDVSLEDAR